MKAYKLKQEYRASQGTLFLFKTAFLLTALAFLLIIGATIFAPEESYTLDGTTLSSELLFGSLFLVVAVFLAAYVVLWAGMLHFLVYYDGTPSFRKGLWFFICLLGLSYGAALYYWFVYRKFLDIASLAQRQEHAGPA